MTEIRPFRAIRYNKDKVGTMDAVMAPPYDVISPQLQDELYRRHPYNIVRLILGKTSGSDRPGDDRYSRAAADLARWLDEGVLVRDEKPALYYYTQTFEIDGVERTRKGFIALARLEELGGGSIHAHERTLSGPKADRLRLMEACKANFSSIFSLYSDPELTLNRLFDSVTGEPHLDVADDEGVRNRLWVVDDPDVLRRAAESMAGRSLFIADGHHRYETALNYRRMMLEARPDATGLEPFNYVMMYFSNMDDEGMVVLPTHRIVHGLEGFDGGDFLRRVGAYFHVTELPFGAAGEADARRRLFAGLDEAHRAGRNAFGLFMRGRDSYCLLTLKDRSVLDRLLGPSVPEVYKSLDVTVLHSLIIGEVLGVTQEDQARQKNLIYVKGSREVIERGRDEKAQLLFIMNPTDISEVKAVAEAGLVMPQKSTYFYPKLLSGLTINPLAGEEAVCMESL
ncbi:MAG TPA: DUF1015 domain-containing protein [Deltaproteobacteria bacterium]|nr:DUF1015 domain-containing protein [Deltaproteobacteria bacterium]